MAQKIRRLISIAIVLCFMCSQVIMVWADDSDISGHWASETIAGWISAGLVKNNPDGTFKPDSPITRAEFVSLINRVFGYSEESDAALEDVAEGKWYAGDISKAVAAGLIIGDGKGTFRPESPISRQEAAVIICKAFGLKANDAEAASQFTDAAGLPSWSKDAVNAVVENGILSGRPDHSLGYAVDITRAESVIMLDNAVGELKNKAGTYTGDAAGNLVVNTKDVVLKDMTINGNLYLTQGIGDGDITLDNVKVNGKTFVFGGGEHSVTIKNSSLTGTLVILKKDGKIRIVAQGSSNIPNVELNSGALLEEDGVTGPGFGDLEVISVIAGQEITLDGDFDEVAVQAPGADVKLLDGVVKNLEIAEEAGNSTVSISKDASLTNLTANAGVTVTGQGSITNAKINSDNVTIEQKPSNVTVAAGFTATVGGKTTTGSTVAPPPAVTGGGGGGDNHPPQTIPATTVSGTITVDAGILDTTGASIQLKLNGANSGSAVHPAADGTYTITGVEAGTYTIEAALSGYKTETTPSFSVSGTPVTGKNILLKKFTTISGTVSAESGVIDTTGTSIQLKLDGVNSGSPVHPAPDGTYTIADVTAGTYTIAVVSPGYATGTITSFVVTAGVPVIGKDLTLTGSVETVAGDLYISPTTAVPGDTRTLLLTYSAQEEFINGTVIFNIPAEFAADTGDSIAISSGGSYSYLDSSQISNSGATVTIAGVNLEENFGVTLQLEDKLIPVQGSYSFAATGDADGSLTEKSMSAGTNGETKVFASAPGPIDDLTALAGNGFIALIFSKATGATAVELETSLDGENYAPVDDILLDSSSEIVMIEELNNGTPYYFRLNVAGGVHAGISNVVFTSPSRVDDEESSATIDVPLTTTTTSAITVFLKDENGSEITTADAYLVTVYTFTDFYINSDYHTGSYVYEILMTGTPSEDGEAFFTVTIPEYESDLYFRLVVSDVNGYEFQEFNNE